MKARSLLPTVAFFGVATGGLHPLVALGLVRIGENDLVVGAVTSAFYIGAFLGATTCRRFVDSLGYRRSLVAAALIASAGTAALAVADLWSTWAALRLLTGYALGAYYVMVESWIVRTTPPARRSTNLATYETVRLVAVAVGPLALTVSAAISGFLVGGLVMLVAIGPLMFASAEPAPSAQRTSRVSLHLIRRVPAGLGACLIGGVYAGSFNGLGAIFAKGAGFDGSGVVLFMSAVLLAPVLFQLPLGHLSDRYGRRCLMLLASVAAAVCGGMLFVGFTSQQFAMVALAMLFGGLCYPLYALGVALLSESLDSSEMLAATGLSNIAYNVGAISGPLLAAGVMMRLGSDGLYGFLALMALLVPVLLLATSDWACLRPGCCSGAAA